MLAWQPLFHAAPPAPKEQHEAQKVCKPLLPQSQETEPMQRRPPRPVPSRPTPCRPAGQRGGPVRAAARPARRGGGGMAPWAVPGSGRAGERQRGRASLRPVHRRAQRVPGVLLLPPRRSAARFARPSSSSLACSPSEAQARGTKLKAGRG